MRPLCKHTNVVLPFLPVVVLHIKATANLPLLHEVDVHLTVDQDPQEYGATHLVPSPVGLEAVLAPGVHPILVLETGRRNPDILDQGADQDPQEGEGPGLSHAHAPDQHPETREGGHTLVIAVGAEASPEIKGGQDRGRERETEVGGHLEVDHGLELEGGGLVPEAGQSLVPVTEGRSLVPDPETGGGVIGPDPVPETGIATAKCQPHPHAQQEQELVTGCQLQQ